ncbi:unnamed protein product [Pleuronectes platessa]|uniref:Uncharacterized protein n=1 Tax=Pleuronectes platessa TaxID=8262 RepID=A0A9N7TML0_PLEPL|nr:unnamed protein product [Pleuronectes platessa]
MLRVTSSLLLRGEHYRNGSRSRAVENSDSSDEGHSLVGRLSPFTSQQHCKRHLLQDVAVIYRAHNRMALSMWVAGGLEMCGGERAIESDKYCCLQPGAGHHDSRRLIFHAPLINSQQHRRERETRRAPQTVV